jgi:hypothetical protein
VPYFTIDLFTTGYVFHGCKGSLITTSDETSAPVVVCVFTFALDHAIHLAYKVFP